MARHGPSAALRRLSLLVTIPLALIVVVFAVANRAPIAVSLWPLPWGVELPGYLIVLGSVLVGFLAGGLIAWLSGGKHRRKARRLAAETERLRAELAETKRRQAAPGAPPALPGGTARPVAIAELPPP